jgi:hypothetical protein
VVDSCSRRASLTVFLLIVSGASCAGIDCANRGGDALPASAFAVPVSRAREMQRLLDEHGSIRLDPAGDYRRATGVTLRSGQAMYGAAGTRMGRLIVAPGTSGAIVSGVVPDALEFPSSKLRTHDNCFERFGARASPQQPLRLVNVVVENNLFQDGGSITIDTSRGGRVTNNRFIRTLVHGVWPALKVEGRDRNSPDRNVFLWMNVLGAQGDGIILRREAELNLLAFDAENWNRNREARMPAMLTASEIGTLRTFIAHGGDPKPDPGAFMDIDATRFELTAAHLIRAADPAIRLHASVEQFVDLMSVGTTYREDAVRSRLTAFRNWSGDMQTDSGGGALSTGGFHAVPWEPPAFSGIPAPADKDWRAARRHATDARASLQERIDREGIVQLPVGVFYISGPLRLRNGQGIIGSGAGKTAIVSMSDDADLVVGGDHYEGTRPSSFVLMDITLQGGRAGIRHDADGAGRGAQFNLIHLSHVVFRDMSDAGIVVDGIYGWDNNLIDNVTFHHMPVGVRQVPNPRYGGPVKDGDVAGMNYMDKNVFYRCRFEDVGTGMRLIAKRANGLNACIECRFANFSVSAVELTDNLSTLIANSDFLGSGSGPVIRSNQLLGVVASRFAGVRDKAVVLDADVACEDCRVTAARGAVALMAAPGRQVSLVNSRIGDAVFPKVGSAVLIDTEAPGAGPQGRLRILANGQWKTLVGGVPTPAPALLVEWQH